MVLQFTGDSYTAPLKPDREPSQLTYDRYYYPLSFILCVPTAVIIHRGKQ